MKPYNLRSSVLYAAAPRLSSSGLEAAAFFGLKKSHFDDRLIRPAMDINIYAGDICLITGASGSGKTQLLEEFFYSAAPLACMADANPAEAGRPLIDQLGGTVFERLKSLYACGIREAYTMFSTPKQLSRGECFRFELCRAILSGKRLIFCDEFCSCLDDLSGAALCRHIRELANRDGYSFVLSSANEEIAKALKPDIIIYTNAQSQPVIRFQKRELP
ncbi:Aliphatic sulfonates import ATP-binding protein SsuB [Limihaloglobus sulfuriphilus]|uniref:Aliphatic sulfonates import ATP-binding protein SsuB n=1 Tax=Limihaloglobus sulfuriphilus TaxID=1851148 RepID=A0A1Q2MF19_9BACT|nr:hypothetical protein [Limihaloglobus sulfuriphilus]AQQ71296.1 Aliphatic sulfonates import ATP-binding protein SsuB [Limihaloglobus sulfuriphilus]